MLKKTLSLLLALSLLLGLFLPLAVAEEEYVDPGYYYVYTENGKTLNVRDAPGGNKVGSLKYGTRIHVDGFTNENWALITFHYNKPGYGPGDYACWVNRRFLTKKKPPDRKSSSTTTTTTVTATTDDPLTAMNKEFQSAKKVENPYKAILRPARVSSWVNLHWGPSTSTELMANYKANTAVLVLEELDNWFQVEEPETGNVGFVMKRFVSE